MEEKKKVNTGAESLFRRVIGYKYQQVVSESIRESATQTASKKVTDMVGTFLKEDSNGFKASTTKAESEKVTDMVGTFLSEMALDVCLKE